MEVLEQLLSDPIYGYIDSSSFSSTTNSTVMTTRLRIGTFSVASNVTGRIADTQTITALLHQYNVLSFWDYATGASYLPIDMNPTPSLLSSSSSSSSASASMDALFLSPHKILGGSAGSCGILIIKKYLVSTTQPPERSGGGTVFYVTNTHHRFLSNRIDRYEGGTPNIPCILRIGLTFLNQRYLQQQQLQQQVEANHHKLGYYNHKNHTAVKHYLSTWQTVVDRLTITSPNLIILGSKHYIQNKNNSNKTTTSTTSNETNLPIFSFLIQCGSRFLHHNYVCALLNDMFGIQTRGGCQCAGPYSQYLLGLTTNDNFLLPNEANQRLEEALLSDKIEILRVGFTKLSLPHLYMRDFEIEYVMKALEFISQHGWKFLYQYRCNHRTGEWRHFSRQGKPLGSHRKWLHQFCPPFLKHQHSNYTRNHHDSNKNIVTHQESKTINETDEECCNERNSYSPPLSDSSNKYNTAADETKIKTDSEKLSLNAWKDLLDFTLEKANKLLQQIHLDTKSIVPIMNSTANDSDILPQSVQDLRWYIYPSECAKMLYEGMEPKSNSQQELVKILGAVQPLERKPPTTDIVEDVRQSKMSCIPMVQNEKLGPSQMVQNITNDNEKSLIQGTTSSCGAINGGTSHSATTCITQKILMDSSTWGEPYPIGSCVPPSYCCAPTMMLLQVVR
jgi:selenocysteine lyase/cysteine desulfurase